MPPTVVAVSDAERAAGSLRPGPLAAAAAALRSDGFVVLDRAIAPQTLSRLGERMAADLPRAMAEAEARYGGAAHNFVWGNVQQGPVLALPGFCDAEVFANPWALQLLAEVLRRSPGQGLQGPGFSSGVSGNTNLGLGSRTQPVHRDAHHNAPPLTMFVINYPLSDVDETTGSIEIWPGTHLETQTAAVERARGELWRGNIPLEISEARRRVAPPVRVNTRLGAMIVRDANCWHRGTPSTSLRFMPALGLRAANQGAPPAEVEFAQGTETEVAQAQRNLEVAGFGGGWSAVFVPEAELSETARGGCAEQDRRYLFPFDTRGTWHVAKDTSSGETAKHALAWGRPATVGSPDDGGAGWCEWYWGESGKWMRKDLTSDPKWMREGPAAYLQAEEALRKASL